MATTTSDSAEKKAFGLWSAVFLGIGSMVGAGIFIVIGEAGAIAGNLVWLSFVFGGIAALLSGYSLAKLAIAYPSRGGIVEYLVQGFGEGVFSGSAGVLFYFSQLIAIAAVAKSFGTYAGTLMGGSHMVNWYALGIVGFFTLINLLGASLVAKSENIIVFIKLSVLMVFTGIALFYINPKLLSVADMPPMKEMLFAVGLTFFAYQGFSVITNTKDNAACDGDHHSACRCALHSYFGGGALLATASAINATLYAATEIGYTMAKDGELPKVYSYNVFQSFEGLIVSALLIVPMILFLNLSEVTTIAALVVLIIQGITHVGHLFRIKQTGANVVVVLLAVVAMFAIAALTLYHTSQKMPDIGFYLMGAFVAAFGVEVTLRLVNHRTISKQTHKESLLSKIEDKIRERVPPKE